MDSRLRLFASCDDAASAMVDIQYPDHLHDAVWIMACSHRDVRFVGGVPRITAGAASTSTAGGQKPQCQFAQVFRSDFIVVVHLYFNLIRVDLIPRD
jgi:hypothetical protein